MVEWARGRNNSTTYPWTVRVRCTVVARTSVYGPDLIPSIEDLARDVLFAPNETGPRARKIGFTSSRDFTFGTLRLSEVLLMPLLLLLHREERLLSVART